MIENKFMYEQINWLTFFEGLAEVEVDDFRFCHQNQTGVFALLIVF